MDLLLELLLELLLVLLLLPLLHVFYPVHLRGRFAPPLDLRNKYVQQQQKQQHQQQLQQQLSQQLQQQIHGSISFMMNHIFCFYVKSTADLTLMTF